MSIFGFLIKSKKEMEKVNTAHIKMGKYILTPHAQNRIADKTRKINKSDVLSNLFTKPNGITKIKYENNRPSYNRVGKHITTSINPTNNKVVSCRPISKQDRKEFDLINIKKKGQKKKYVKRNSKKQVQTTSKRSRAKSFERIKHF